MSEDLYIILGCWAITVLATERTTEIIHESKFFFPLRNLVAQAALREGLTGTLWLLQLPCKFVHAVISCAWCLSVWISLFFALFLPGEYFLRMPSDNIMIKWLALVGFANLWHAIFRLIFRGRVITIDIRHTIDHSGDPDGLAELGIVVGEEDGGDTESPI